MDAHRPPRRETLRRLAGLTLTQALPATAWADPAALNTLPRTALVIGNAAYRSVAELANPVNDAKGIAARLGDMRFNVLSRTDAAKAAMQSAIDEYVGLLARSKSVGLFYFAGHGFQMAWRNYLVPVDAALDKGEDVARNTIDLTAVLEGLRRAGNPMNIVILDACRDNPFGADARTGKGLSQLDAPVGTFLAYATSPGNTASDGEGANGLYTENLLREMRAPDAKIEDIFKRVRLNVRRASNGRQIPWESTSLEEDFYFVPPASLARASPSESERRYVEELALWQAADAKAAAADMKPGRAELEEAIAALEDCLRRHPSGHFAELAQVRLDRLLARRGEKRVAPVAPPSAFTHGAVLNDTAYQLGDRYDVRITDRLTGLAQTESRIVTAITDLQVVFNDGEVIVDPLGNPIQQEGRRFADTQHYPSEFAVGRKWSTRYRYTMADGQSDFISLDYVVKGRETVRTPAGTFDAFRVEGNGRSGRGGKREHRYWTAPDRVRRWVILEQRWWDRRGSLLRDQRSELIAFFERSRAPA